MGFRGGRVIEDGARNEASDTTTTQLGMILHDSVESSVVHSLILKPFEIFYYNSM